MRWWVKIGVPRRVEPGCNSVFLEFQCIILPHHLKSRKGGVSLPEA